VRKFRYLFDPVCLAACALYALNRWMIKPHTSDVFFHGWFNDVLLIPCALPPMLWMHRRLNLRVHDGAPTTTEVLGHLAWWTFLFEGIGPYLMTHTTGDWMDAIAYAIGALLALACWRGPMTARPLPS
jgi:hypothetical protein